MVKQLSLFEDEAEIVKIKAEFKDYDDWIAHFSVNPKTTDECWTPPDVYAAVIDFLEERIGIGGRKIVRPFFPGGNYTATEYPENCIVVDNPPFSMFKEIVNFYRDNKIDFYLFGPALTIGNVSFADTSIVVTGCDIKYQNGAKGRRSS